MKKNNTLKSVYILFFGLLLITFACKKDNTPAAPDIPPQSTFIMDFSAFGNGTSESIPPSVTKSGQLLTNYQTAALTVGYWNTILYLKTAIPTACFKEAFNHKPSYLGSNSWQWKYSVAVGNYNVTSKLQAMLVTDSVLWKNMISVSSDSLNVTDFIWFTGISALNGGGGSWTINESPSLPNALFSITWVKRSNLIGSIQYTYVKDGEQATGDYIKFGTKDSSQVVNNVYYVLHKANPVAVDTDIEWNSVTKAGRYHDINGWHCWDSNKLDINCN
jgi:hypothetical protein